MSLLQKQWTLLWLSILQTNWSSAQLPALLCWMYVREIKEFLAIIVSSFCSTRCLHVQRSAGNQMANSWLLAMRMGMFYLWVKVLSVLILTAVTVVKPKYFLLPWFVSVLSLLMYLNHDNTAFPAVICCNYSWHAGSSLSHEIIFQGFTHGWNALLLICETLGLSRIQKAQTQLL